jgi:hypothetical protein
VVRYVADYEVGRNTIRFFASFDGGATHEGEFDFDPTQLDAAAAVDAFLQNHIEKADWDAAPLILPEHCARRYFQRRVQIRSSELSPPACARTVSCRARR